MNAHESEQARPSPRTEADARWDEALRLLRGESAAPSQRTGSSPEAAPSGAAEQAPASDNPPEPERATTLELQREELQPHKVTHETAGVEVHKEVVSEMRTIQVPVRRERVTIERVPAMEPRRDGESEGEGQSHGQSGPVESSAESITVPVREEEIVIQKRPVVIEEVTVGKRASEHIEHVAETVRVQQPRIETSGDPHLRGEHRGGEPQGS